MFTQRKLIQEGKARFEMEPEKIRAFLKEFPHLKRYADYEKFRQYYVSVLEAGVFDYKLAEEDEFHELPSLNFSLELLVPSHEEMLFLDENWEIVQKKETFPYFKGKKYVFWGPLVQRELTLSAEGKADKFFSIHLVINGFKDHHPEVRFVVSRFLHTRAVIVYKIPQTGLKGLCSAYWKQPQIPGLEEFKKA